MMIICQSKIPPRHHTDTDLEVGVLILVLLSSYLQTHLLDNERIPND